MHPPAPALLARQPEAPAQTPPWEWPPDSGNTLLAFLGDRQADESERLAAAELAGEIVVINEDLADT